MSGRRWRRRWASAVVAAGAIVACAGGYGTEEGAPAASPDAPVPDALDSAPPNDGGYSVLDGSVPSNGSSLEAGSTSACPLDASFCEDFTVPFFPVHDRWGNGLPPTGGTFDYDDKVFVSSPRSLVAYAGPGAIVRLSRTVAITSSVTRVSLKVRASADGGSSLGFFRLAAMTLTPSGPYDYHGLFVDLVQGRLNLRYFGARSTAAGGPVDIYEEQPDPLGGWLRFDFVINRVEARATIEVNGSERVGFGIGSTVPTALTLTVGAPFSTTTASWTVHIDDVSVVGE